MLLGCAPVLIPTLNRYTHFKQCVSSLAKCRYAEQTDLYIAFDYPANEKQKEGYFLIQEFLNEITGFKSVNTIQRKENYGVVRNISEARQEIFKNYDSIIVSEDDNLFSPNFLEYINKGLRKFEQDPNVYAICGYKHTIQMPDKYSNNYFFYKGFSAWGYGTWKNKFIEPYYHFDDLKKFIEKKDNVLEIKKISNRHYYNIIESILKKEDRRGDFTFFLNNVANNTHCVFPSITKVRNQGYDGSGINCIQLDNDEVNDQPFDQDDKFDFHPDTIKTDQQIIDKYKVFFYS